MFLTCINNSITRLTFEFKFFLPSIRTKRPDGHVKINNSRKTES